jgi:predicted N-acetyltransferase YhbS
MPTTIRTRLVGTLTSDDRVGTGLRRCWLDVSNAGGAVGFPFVPVSDDEMRDAMQRLVDDVASGSLVLFVAESGDELIGWVSLRPNRSDLTRHWATVERLQSRPEHRNEGVGRKLMTAVVEHATTSGLEQLRLVLRGGEGLETFYGQLGWIEIGRHPAALRLSKNDDRDEVMMVLQVPRDSSRSRA